MNLQTNRRFAQHMLLVGGACAFSILFSLTPEAMAQCQNGGGQLGTARTAQNGNAAPSGLQNSAIQGFAGNGFQTTDAQQVMVQNMFQAQLMNMLMQQAQQQNTLPQPATFNRNTTQPTRTSTAPNQILKRTPPPRDPDAPLTKEEQRLEARRIKEQQKREAYQARIDAKEQQLADLKSRTEN